MARSIENRSQPEHSDGFVKQPFLEFWGKARPDVTAAATWHPAACHCLDVAAVAEALLNTQPDIATLIAARCGWTLSAFIKTTVFLIALHDTGKFSRSFQGLAPERWPPSLTGPRLPGPRHDVLGLAMLTGIDAILDVLGASLGQWRESDIKALLGAVAGHHGRPVASLDLETRHVCGVCRAAAGAFVTEVAALLSPPILPPPPKGAARLASWWLAGLTTLCDWIGSSSATWFPYVGDRYKSLESYWPIARQQAAVAIRQSGLLPVAPAPRRTLSALIPFIVDPTPIQHLAEITSLPNGPLCVIIEDATGSGKTEAALMIAHRLIAEGRADGLFIALPTMATADAMFARLAESYRALFAENANPSLALAHGRAELNTLFQGSILAGAEIVAAEEAEDAAETASAQCAAWLAEERRRVFFAHVGVGTIDQALLGVLAARHAALRLFGLARKVLVVDEAHAYDPYMAEELKRLLAFHAMQGGSSVILSATLPQRTRGDLLQAFAQELGATPYRPATMAYPLMTIAGTAQSAEHPATMRPELHRTVPVRRLASVDAAVAALAEAARAGACGIWVRNTVDDARLAAEALQAAGITPILFHARFAMGDRLHIQGEVLGWFGKAAAAEDRAPGGLGRVLVATQVVEQSLDLDADVMVTDLAPIDLLIQRAGRLQRHPKRTRPPGFTTPELLVVSPDPVSEPDEAWARDAALGGTAFVYAPHILWLSARVLFAAGEIVVTAGLRTLVEAVYGAEAEAVPPGLSRAETRYLGRSEAERGQARFNLLDPAAGYAIGNGTWESDVVMPTRLGDDYVSFRMAREEDGALVPFCADADPARAWALSEIALRKSIADDAGAPPAVVRVRADWPRWQRESPVLVMSNDGAGGWVTAALKKTEPVRLTYTSELGLAGG
jgi:CRISPR-associated endonuclease/helicase Cas3